MTDDDLEIFRKMLDPKHWPIKPERVLIADGEVWAFVTDNPEEECLYRPLYR